MKNKNIDIIEYVNFLKNACGDSHLPLLQIYFKIMDMYLLKQLDEGELNIVFDVLTDIKYYILCKTRSELTINEMIDIATSFEYTARSIGGGMIKIVSY